MNTITAPPIMDRYVPPVAGIDLQQSLNYTSSEGLDLAWFYECFTYPRVFYKPGQRPMLDVHVKPVMDGKHSALDKLYHCMNVIEQRMPHFAYLGYDGPADRAMTEEQLLMSGKGWCNEQVRVLIALTQAAGLPSRMVFAAMVNKRGHVLTEVWVDNKWVLVDQTENYLFTQADGQGVNVLDFKTSESCWQEVDHRYKAHMIQRRSNSKNKAFWGQVVPYGVIDHPLELFYKVGYCNYFIH